MSKARSLNKVMLIGNLTRDPVLRETSTGVIVCSFGIATNTSWKDKDGGYKEKAEYHNIIAFNKLGEICAQVLTLGMLVYVEGELRTRIKEGENGVKIYRTEIKLNDMILIDAKGKKGVGIEKAKEIGSTLPSPSEGIDEGVENSKAKHIEEEFKGEDLF